jgi:AcrR family transcriptional regulator
MPSTEVLVSPSDLTAPPRRTQAERRQDAELALLTAATRLFAENGIDNTSLADIGQEAGYSRGLVNHHFGSKAALVERLAARAQADFIDTVGKPAPSNEIETLHVVIDSYLDRVAEGATTPRAFFVMWGAALPSGSPLRPIFMADDAHFRGGVEAIIRSGQANGRIEPTVDAKSVAVAFVALLRGIGAQYIIDPAGIDIAACKTTTTALVRRALAASQPEPPRAAS